MAITRIQSIRVHDLDVVLDHRINTVPHEQLLKIVLDSAEDFEEEIDDILAFSPDYKSAAREILEYSESAKYTRAIRKNSVVQELIIAYSPEDLPEDEEEALSMIKSDVFLFSHCFQEKFEFRPTTVAFVHRTKDTGLYHVHVLFSLMDVEKARKARWKRRSYFDIVKRMSSLSPRISVPPRKDKSIGAYPIWLRRKIESTYGREIARDIMSLARERKIRTKDLIERYHELSELVKRKKDGLTPGT